MAKAIPCVIGILALLSHPGLTISSLYPAPISELTDAVSRRHSGPYSSRHSEPGEESRPSNTGVWARRDPSRSLRMTGGGTLSSASSDSWRVGPPGANGPGSDTPAQPGLSDPAPRGHTGLD